MYISLDKNVLPTSTNVSSILMKCVLGVKGARVGEKEQPHLKTQDTLKGRDKQPFSMCLLSLHTSTPSFSHTPSTFSSSRTTHSSVGEPVGHWASDMPLFTEAKRSDETINTKKR